MQMIEYQHLDDTTVYISETPADDVEEDEGAFILWWGPELIDGYETLEEARAGMRSELEEVGVAYEPVEGGVPLAMSVSDREAHIGNWREADQDEDDDEY
ncbi:hypothetical protein ACFVH6_21720 [Spirillospora sp. NPDC127200]